MNGATLNKQEIGAKLNDYKGQSDSTVGLTKVTVTSKPIISGYRRIKYNAKVASCYLIDCKLILLIIYSNRKSVFTSPQTTSNRSLI